VKRTVCYIAMGLVFNEAGQVLLIQEAKASCRGKWYIPAGRIEPNENFIVSCLSCSLLNYITLQKDRHKDVSIWFYLVCVSLFFYTVLTLIRSYHRLSYHTQSSWLKILFHLRVPRLNTCDKRLPHMSQTYRE